MPPPRKCAPTEQGGAQEEEHRHCQPLAVRRELKGHDQGKRGVSSIVQHEGRFSYLVECHHENKRGAECKRCPQTLDENDSWIIAKDHVGRRQESAHSDGGTVAEGRPNEGYCNAGDAHIASGVPISRVTVPTGTPNSRI